ncbi:MAG: class I SAM-dependent methyltransferase [Myxococcota bacterium]|nr:class I SAM-dependent methyltransferase [Myxococcota bacterium]
MMDLVRRTARHAADFVDLYHHWLHTSVREAAPAAHGRLLDVGCGAKPFEPFFAPFVTGYVGVEYQAVFSSTDASKRVTKPDLFYDGKTLPFEAHTFDTVLSTEVLEHTREPMDLVGEMARVLKPDGTLILTTPFALRLHEEPYDYYRFTRYGLAAMVERFGLRVVEARSFGGVWSVVGQKINSHLAFRVGRLQGFGQQLGKGAHEPTNAERPRLWTVPLLGPPMVGISAAARLLDRYVKDPTETLGFLVVAVGPEAQRSVGSRPR